MIQSELKQAISEVVQKNYLKSKDVNFTVTHPELEDHGDYTTNIALILARQVGADPEMVAKKIVDTLPKPPYLDRIEVVKPGFINFHLMPSYYLSELSTIRQEKINYGRMKTRKVKKYLFEFGQPNTHKVSHIGHLFSYIYGESCVRLLEAIGHEVKRANYQGDIGLHVAKCLWAVQKRIKNQESGIKNDELEKKITLLQECYQEGSLAYEEDEQAKQEIDELNLELYRKENKQLTELWQETRQWSIDYYKTFEARLGTHFDRYYYESELIDRAVSIVKEHTPRVFESDAGAYIFRGEKYGLHTRVFVNRFGNPTYEAKDIALAEHKAQGFSFDTSVVTTASEQNEYWRVVGKVIELIWPEYKGKLRHIGFGMINLTTGKMSSRTGNIVTAFSLVEAVKERVREYISENREYTPTESERITEVVALGAIKYSFLKSSPTKNITFDLESSIDFNGNSGPYLLYTYARTQSILKKAGEQKSGDFNNVIPNSEELAILRYLHRFPEIVAEAAEAYAPHVLATYLFELAQRYSTFYNEHQIVTGDTVGSYRVVLTGATSQVLGNGLTMLGIELADQI